MFLPLHSKMTLEIFVKLFFNDILKIKEKEISIKNILTGNEEI